MVFCSDALNSQHQSAVDWAVNIVHKNSIIAMASCYVTITLDNILQDVTNKPETTWNKEGKIGSGVS